jgi:isopenicillin N synthase-like dioxygenase
MTGTAIPLIDVGSLFAPASPARDAADRAILAAASSRGIMTITGLPDDVPIGADARRELLRVFALPAALLQERASNTTDPSRPFASCGYIPCRSSRAFYYDGMQIGPDIAYGDAATDQRDPLRRPTHLPPEPALPGWREAAKHYFLAMACVGAALIAALGRGLGVPAAIFADLFTGGSALRLLRYPLRPPEALAGIPADELYVTDRGERRMLASEAHVDFGCITLLAQDGVGGLQARAGSAWIDVPPAEGTLVVNFGELMARWTGGRIKAVEHRVLSPECERFSIPFFCNPRIDALIAPLPIAGAEDFAPVRYGDYVWSSLPRYRRLFGERVVVPA